MVLQSGQADPEISEAVNKAMNEMASLYHDTLGNLAYFDTAGDPKQPGWGLKNIGPFLNIQSDYWIVGLEPAPSTIDACHFDFGTGLQCSPDAIGIMDVWVVQPGDISVVPVPAAWLFGSGLIGLIGWSRCNQKAA